MAADGAAKQDIAEVLVRYATGIDRRDWDLFRSCFAVDCLAEYEGIGTWESADAITDFMVTAHAAMGHTMHRISNVAIDVLGDGGRAVARSYVDGILMAADGQSGFNPIGFYDDELVRTPDAGRLAHRPPDLHDGDFPHTSVIRGTVPSVMGTIAPASASAADADECDPYGDPDVDLETLSTEAIMGLAAGSSRRIAREKARFVKYTRVIEKREGWRAEGATSLEAWMVERCGISRASARSYGHVGEQLEDRPHLTAGLSSGDLTFDKVAAIVDVATPANDRELADLALECTVRQLQEVARAERGAPSSQAETDHEARSVRFNDGCHTVTAVLPSESYAQVKSCLETGARALPSDGETRWDQRLCDVYMEKFGSDGQTSQGASPYVVVVHAPLETLADESSELAGDLERGGLISAETVRRLACDATVIVALDDDLGHTMYEGRARRFPTGSQRREVMRRDRHCRFPGCANVTFTNVHHIKPWGSGGRTDLENLVLMCQHHHYRLHSSGWSMTGDANEELTLVAPTGRVMTSRPSPLWATR